MEKKDSIIIDVVKLDENYLAIISDIDNLSFSTESITTRTMICN